MGLRNIDVMFSIITPVYNSFNLMDRYFKSLNNQTFKNFEVILVDDYSNDGTYENLEKLISFSKLNIKLLRTEQNSGPGNARNLGLEHAEGKWITFIDNDDWIDIFLLEKINKILSDNKINCVIYDYFTTNGKKNRRGKSVYHGNGGILNRSDSIAYTRNHVVGKFYRYSLLHQNLIKFPNLKRCEDVAFVVRAITVCQPAYYLDEPLYYYYQRSNSLSNNRVLDEKDMIKAFEVVENNLRDQYPEEVQERSVPDLLYGAVLMMAKSNKSKYLIEKHIIQYEKKYPLWYQSNIIEHLGLFKRIFLIFIRYRAYKFIKVLAIIHTFLIRV